MELGSGETGPSGTVLIQVRRPQPQTGRLSLSTSVVSSSCPSRTHLANIELWRGANEDLLQPNRPNR